MNIVIIVFISLIVFVLVRFSLVALSLLIGRIFKVPENKIGFHLAISVLFYFLYVTLFLVFVIVISDNRSFSNAEWYFVYAFIGISAILWCYFSWEMKFRALPKFGGNDSATIIKKILVYAFVMVFSFYHGYSILNEKFSGQNVDLLTTIVNITVIPGVIALDRLLNQFKNLQSKKN